MPVPVENPKNRGGLSPFRILVQVLALPARRSLPDMDFGRVYDAAGDKVSLAEPSPVLNLLSFI
jgi:hypothetical protein